jgi:fibronectin type 3 domain-containing protein
MDADEKTTQSEEKGANEIGAIPTPSGLTASDGSFADKIHLKWRASENATTYEVYRAQTFCGDKTKIGSTAATDFNDKSVPDKLVYYYWVKAINKELGTSEFSNYDTGFLMRAPDAPTGVKASDGTYLNKILISWNAVPVASYYEVYRAEWSGAAKTKLGTTSKTSFYDAGVECSTCCPDDYAYFVKAANDAGISAFSDYDSGYVYKTLRDPDATATDGLDCCVFVKWETVGGAKSYRIYRASSLDGPKMIVDTRSAEDACRRYVFRDTTVTCPKVYYYWVKALDGRGYTSCIYGAPDSGYCGNCAGD